MARSFRDVEYSKVDLNSPKKDFTEDTSVGVNDGDEDEHLNNANSEQQEQKKPSLLSLAYYQQFFNVDTKQVAFRTLGSFVPRPGKNILADDIRHSPDLYGPFWVTTTLVFTTAIAGNLANYLQAAAENKQYTWVYDFRKVTFSATAIYVYWWLMPFILWAFCWWRQVPEKYKFLELLCLYGYSLSVYIPVSILWVIQISVLQWLLLVVSLLLSGAVLMQSLWPSLTSGNKKTGIIMLIFIGLMHSLLAFGFMLYFFHVTSSAAVPSKPTIATLTSAGAIASKSASVKKT